MPNITVAKRIRPRNNAQGNIPENQFFLIEEWEDLHFYNDKIVLHTSLYKSLFKRLRKNEGLQSKKGIVKIVNNINNRTIYRQYYGQSSILKTEVGLTSLSMNEIGISQGEVNITICGSSLLRGRLIFFWRHPYIEVRVPTKIALISIVVGVVSFIFALISILFSLN